MAQKAETFDFINETGSKMAPNKPNGDKKKM